MTGEKVNPIPNMLTGLRLVAGVVMFVLLAGVSGGIPFMSASMNQEDIDPFYRWAFIAFVVGALTDLFDGMLARSLHAESQWGAILDPIADKILVCGTILGLFTISPQPSFALPAALILFREFAVSALRESAAARGVTFPVTLLAKWKTTLQLVALGTLLLVESWTAFGLDVEYVGFFYMLGNGLLLLATAVTLWTGWVYFRAAMKSV
jgi:CDP-diacylglycerol--glycerol-3-phosphate 3-phosphatidyltransferase